MPKVKRVIDKSDDNVIDNGLLPSVRFFGLLCGKTGSSKTTLMVNMLCSDEFPYNKIFKGDNIYIFSGSLDSDLKIQKLIEFYDVAESNLYRGFDNEELNLLYDKLEEDYMEKKDNDEPIDYPLVILDDLSFSLSRGKDFNSIKRFAQNSRKLAISVLITTQHYSQVELSVRNNISFACLYHASAKNVSIMEEEHNYLGGKKKFMTMWNENVKSKRDFICINYDNDGDQIYLNSQFEPIFKHHDC